MLLTLLLLYTSVSCLSIAAGSYNYYGFSHLTDTKIHSNGLPEARELHKRQVPDDDNLRHCQGIIEDVQCTNGLVQKSVNLTLLCNMSLDANVLELGCRRNTRGDYYVLAVTYQMQVDTIKTTCRNISNTCTTACKYLLMSIREELGCCINTIYNNSNSVFNMPDPFRFALWSQCGVQPIPKECAPSNIRIIPTGVDPTCDLKALQDRLINLTCTKSFIQPVIDKLNVSGDCQPYIEAVMEGCGVDKSGEWCNSANSLANMNDGFVVAQAACQDTTTCTHECMQALQNFDDSSGCCINSVFNNSLAGISAPSYDFLSFKFWSECGLHTPGICKTRFNGTIGL